MVVVIPVMKLTKSANYICQSLRVAVIQGDANEHQPARTVTMQCTKTLTMIMQDKSTKNLTAIFIYPQRKKADA